MFYKMVTVFILDQLILIDILQSEINEFITIVEFTYATVIVFLYLLCYLLCVLCEKWINPAIKI